MRVSKVRLNSRRLKQVGFLIGLILLIALPRLLDIGGYIIVDEADRWRWAKEFVYALNRGDLAATLVGDGYPGIVPVWAESLWIFLEAARRSIVAGQWIGEAGLYHLFHEWDRTAYLAQQRLPIVLLNVLITLVVVGAVWRLFGKRVALVSGLLIALDPFYLSDSRVNRAEAVVTGLMTLSVLSLIFYDRHRHFRYIIISGIFGGLSFLTKIQALAILPAVALTGLLVCVSPEKKAKFPYFPFRVSTLYSLKNLIEFGFGWIVAACLTWFILWPSMWVTPLETLALVYNYTTRKVGAEGVVLFFWGQTYQDADPGLFFYPFVFFMRITPLALVGLIGAILRFTLYVLRMSSKKGNDELSGDPFAIRGSVIFVVYVLVYVLLMTFGSHKQDRYLMPVFLSVDILAAMGLVYIWVWIKSKIRSKRKESKFLSSSRLSPLSSLGWVLLPALVIIQIATVLSHHPYYYSYFNPLFGGGQTAVRTMRIGWGEGMDRVGKYLAAKPDSRNLVVSSRFTHNMLDFKGELISLTQDGRWTQADYIVLYIQQVQRRLEPGPGFIDYFQARQPEKVITLGGIDYAWIYPIPFAVSANPQVSVIPRQAALLGYSWEVTDQTKPYLRLLWENLGIVEDRHLVARLVDSTTETEWVTCSPDPNFVTRAQTPGAYVENLCILAVADLPPGMYTMEFGLTAEEIEPFRFPEGWQVVRITPDGEVVDTGAADRLEAIVAERVPAAAQRLDRVYDGRIRLVAHQLEPLTPTPGEIGELTLYWQPVKEVLEPIDLIVQLADSRSISLGRSDTVLYDPLQKVVERQWLPGNVIDTHHTFKLSSKLEGPLAGRIEVTLLNKAEVSLRATNLAGQPLDKIIDRFTIAPAVWPALDQIEQVEGVWQNGITLRGYKILPEQAHAGATLLVSLFWETNQPVAENYVVFVHLLDQAGQLKTQHDSLPLAGAYPIPWWQPGIVIEDTHPLVLPEDLSNGMHQLVVGLYRGEDQMRLSLVKDNDSLVIGSIEVR